MTNDRSVQNSGLENATGWWTFAHQPVPLSKVVEGEVLNERDTRRGDPVIQIANRQITVLDAEVGLSQVGHLNDTEMIVP